MERKLTMKFTPNVLAQWEREHDGLSILSKVATYDMLRSVGNIAMNASKSGNKGLSDDSLREAYAVINKLVSVTTIIELIQIGNLNTIDFEAAANKLENYLDKYDDGIIGAYLQVVKELDSDMKYIGFANTGLGQLIDLFIGKIGSLKKMLADGETNETSTEATNS